MKSLIFFSIFYAFLYFNTSASPIKSSVLNRIQDSRYLHNASISATTPLPRPSSTGFPFRNGSSANSTYLLTYSTTNPKPHPSGSIPENGKSKFSIGSLVPKLPGIGSLLPKLPGINPFEGFIPIPFNPSIPGPVAPPPPATFTFRPTPPRLPPINSDSGQSPDVPTIPQTPSSPTEPEDPNDEEDCTVADSGLSTRSIYAIIDNNEDDNHGVSISRPIYRRLLDHLLRKREEKVSESTNPLKTAFQKIAPPGFKGLLAALLDSITEVGTNNLPKTSQNTWVNGIKGKLKVPRGSGKNRDKGFSVGRPGTDNYNEFSVNEEVPWEVRWDYDPTKGPHVNAVIGRGDHKSKFAVKLVKQRKPNERPGKGNKGGDRGGGGGNSGSGGTSNSDGNSDGDSSGSSDWAQTTMDAIRQGLNTAVGFQPRGVGGGGLSAAEQVEAVPIMRDRWGDIVEGGCKTNGTLY